jgi:DNA modification methylase/ribosomal protein S27AE
MRARPSTSQTPLFAAPTDRTKSRRSDAIYGTHAYHTKVPPAVAAAYIDEYCRPGGTVLDPFCGSGMTGVGAALVGREALLSDISPAAVHIARNYCEPCDPAAFEDAVARVLEAVGSEIEAFYATDYKGAPATVEHVVWSDVRLCPACSTTTLLWDHRHEGLRRLACRACGHTADKSAFTYAGEAPVEASLTVSETRTQVTRPVIGSDTRDVSAPPNLWIPDVPFGAERPMWRKQHQDMGIADAAAFFSSRNLAAIALLWSAAAQQPDPRLRDALRFSITAVINRASRRYQWNAKRPTNVLGGTLYVSSIRYEWNVMSLWRRKVAAVLRLFTQRPVAGGVRVRQESATALSVPDASIDYCFCDPPFGAHIVYSDSSLLWEAWLADLTDRDQEAIIVRSGSHAKSVDAYAALMRGSFEEIRRVLKPDALATVVFQATDTAVWAAISDAARDAGLTIVDVATLDKGQPSFKQIKGRTAGERVAQTDVVMTFRKADEALRPSHQAIRPEELIAAEIRDAGDGCVSVGHLFSLVAAECLRQSVQPLSYACVAGIVDELTGDPEEIKAPLAVL